MLEFAQTVLALIVTLSILVTIHEFGHYYVARLCRVHVLRFSVGFGKPLFIRRGRPPGASGSVAALRPGEIPAWTKSNEPLAGTEFAVAAIPLGGYVKMLDEREGFVPDDQLHLAFNRKSVWQRIAIISAGPIANFLLAIVAYWLLFAAGVTGLAPVIGNVAPDSPAGLAGLRAGQEIVAVDGETTRSWSEVQLRLFSHLGESGAIRLTLTGPDEDAAPVEYRLVVEDWLSDSQDPYPTRALGLVLQLPKVPAVVGGLMAGGRAEAAGLLVGDRIVAVNGVAVLDWASLVEVIRRNPETTLTLRILRAENALSVDLVPETREQGGEQIGFIGMSVEPAALPDEMLREVSYPIYSAWIPALRKTWQVTAFTLESLGKMVTGAISTKNLSGPITIAQVANDTAGRGLESFIGFIALLSISLGVINLLPIPVLDGGHLLYCMIEVIAGRPVPESIQNLGFQVGVLLIVGVMLLAFYNDLARLL